MTRHARIQIAIVVAICVLILVPIASASEPAVDQANFRWAIGYSFEDREAAFGGFFSSIGIAETEPHTLSTAGILVVPLTASSGARIRLSASGARQEADFSPFFFRDDTTWAWAVGTGTDLFLRDPEIGHFDVGYSFAYQELVETGDPDAETHSFNTSAGIFTDGFGIVPVDLELTFSYSRIAPESFSSTTTTYTTLQVSCDSTPILAFGWTSALAGCCLTRRVSPIGKISEQLGRFSGCLPFRETPIATTSPSARFSRPVRSTVISDSPMTSSRMSIPSASA